MVFRCLTSAFSSKASSGSKAKWIDPVGTPPPLRAILSSSGTVVSKSGAFPQPYFILSIENLATEPYTDCNGHNYGNYFFQPPACAAWGAWKLIDIETNSVLRNSVDDLTTHCCMETGGISFSEEDDYLFFTLYPDKPLTFVASGLSQEMMEVIEVGKTYWWSLRLGKDESLLWWRPGEKQKFAKPEWTFINEDRRAKSSIEIIANICFTVVD